MIFSSQNSMRNVLQEKLEYVSKVTQLQVIGMCAQISRYIWSWSSLFTHPLSSPLYREIMTRPSKNARNTKLSTIVWNKRWVFVNNVCVQCFLQTDIQHTQDVIKLSEQLKQAELERKSLQKKVYRSSSVNVWLLSSVECNINLFVCSWMKRRKCLRLNWTTWRVMSNTKKINYYQQNVSPPIHTVYVWWILSSLYAYVERLEETQDELVSLKITMETDKQRQVASNLPISDSVDQTRETFVEEQPLGALPSLQPILIGSVGVSPLSERRPLLRRDTLLSPDNLVFQLESKQKEWECE